MTANHDNTARHEIIIGNDLTAAPAETVARIIRDMKDGHLDEVYVQINLYNADGLAGTIVKEAEDDYTGARIYYGFGKRKYRLPRTSRRSC